MTYHHPCLQQLSNFVSQPSIYKKLIGTIAAILLPPLAFGQDQSQPAAPSDPAQVQVDAQSRNITVPAGTHLALVLTQPVQTRYVRRGDDIYAQVTSPVDAENQVVIPPGTFVQGMVDKIERRGGRGELRLQSMSITFPDGFVTPIAGPIVLETTDGYAIKDPGSKRSSGAIILSLAGVGLGALIGHSVGRSDSTLTSNFPPGCSPPQFGCTPTSTPVMGTKGKDAAIGAGIGGVAGMIASITLLVGGRHFYLDAGAPVQMTLQESVTLPRDEVAKAVRQSQEHAVVVQPVAPRPMPPPVPPNADHRTCYTPDGNPGPPTVIPGIPPTPGTPYPCP